ncbi:hypothetical protein XELAEV_18029564mg [Xenopus laevis]|uniref:Uncharacterized protein n=1 Tax=Xenopus laevis TaxID=8355 RepID=A0A974HHP1_XENLA|nr:hypothetical protein XELAEV_18029564mg [Xenopus laevis]
MHPQSFSVAAALWEKKSEKKRWPTAALACCSCNRTGNQEKGRSVIRNAKITNKMDPKGRGYLTSLPV